MHVRRPFSAVASGLFALALLTACAGAGAPADTAAPAGTTGGGAVGATTGSDATTGGGDASADLLEFTGWPAEVAGYTTDEEPTADSAYYFLGGDAGQGVVNAAIVPDSIGWDDSVSIQQNRFEPAPNSSCGTFQGEVICVIKFSNEVVDFISFATPDEATEFVTAFLAAM